MNYLQAAQMVEQRSYIGLHSQYDYNGSRQHRRGESPDPGDGLARRRNWNLQTRAMVIGALRTDRWDVSIRISG